MPVGPRTILLLLVPLVIASVAANVLAPLEQTIVQHVDSRAEDAVRLLERAVNVPSATENHEGVRRVGEILAGELRALGFETRWLDQSEVGRAGHLVAERRGGSGRRLLLIGHLDTVLQGEAFRRDGARAFGSGIADMKGGDVILIEALRALHGAGALEGRQVIAFFTGDEEDTGRPYAISRAALEEVASRSDVALAFEGYEPGTAVVGRRGFSAWRLDVTGSQGHSSTIFGPDRGSGAVFEAARILHAFHEELREPHLTYNASVVVGGSEVTFDPRAFAGTAAGKTNVVPRTTIVEGDLRFLTRAQLERARERMREIVGRNLPKTSAAITFTDGMPSMEPTDGNRTLLRVMDQVSRDLGTGPIEAHDPSKRGAGDISFVASLVPGLDGLGARGGNEHAPGEYVDLGELPALTKRAALLMHRLMSARQ